jgi:hypothetical protein
MRSSTDGENFQIPSTVDDEAIVAKIIEVLKNRQLEFILKK